MGLHEKFHRSSGTFMLVLLEVRVCVCVVLWRRSVCRITFFVFIFETSNGDCLDGDECVLLLYPLNDYVAHSTPRMLSREVGFYTQYDTSILLQHTIRSMLPRPTTNRYRLHRNPVEYVPFSYCSSFRTCCRVYHSSTTTACFRPRNRLKY